MVLSVFLKLIYPPPASILITAMSVLSFASLGAGWMEIKGKNIPYSKFKTISEGNKKSRVVSSKTGMMVIYGPAFVAGFSSFFLFPVIGFLGGSDGGGGDFRFTLLRTAVTTHFLKRILEVLFVHKYSGSMDVDTMITISLSYFSTATTMIYAQYLAQQLPEPTIDLKYIGVPMFLLGIVGNFYHHYLLTKLRTEGEKRYKIPQGGLFRYVICPHYLFELLGFFGISCISQTLYAFCYMIGTTFYLMGRSSATRQWYRSKFEDFPEHVKALVPYIF